MSERDISMLTARGEDRHDTPGKSEIVRLASKDSVEGVVETTVYRRLTELRVPRGRGGHAPSSTPHSAREALDAFAWGLDPDHQFRLIFTNEGAGAFSFRICFSGKNQSWAQSTRAVADLQAGFDAALAAAGLCCCFANESDPDRAASDLGWQTEILPPGIHFADCDGRYRPLSPLSPRLVVNNGAPPIEFSTLLAPPRVAQFASLDALLRSLAAAKCATRLIISIRSRLIRADETRVLSSIRDKGMVMSSFARTDGLPPLNAREVAQPVAGLLRSIEREGRAIELSVRIEAAAPLSDTILRLAAAVFWGAHQFSKEQAIACRDWRRLIPVGYQLPQWLPSTAALEALGTPIRLAPSRREPCEGRLLGKTSDGDEVRLTEAALARHLYCVGATGSGKSTLLANLVLQDIAANRGLLLIDPHGDITADVLARVPPKATKRVVSLDLADPDYTPGLNMLNVGSGDPDMAKSLICGELLRIFKTELYPDVPEGFGPMFETYFRNALMLLLETEGPSTATIVDVPRVFQDDRYRELLIDCCPNRHVRDFWKRTAGRVTHTEIELENITPYVTSKFEPFLGSRSIRTIVGQPNTTLDFGTFMDQGHAVLISLAKGALGTNEARVLGLLLLQQIQIACMARVRRPQQERRAFTLYVDEAQSFIGGALTELLAEARKFGLSLVLANQTMAQLSGRTSRALIDLVLGNVANLLALRVGVSDAEVLAPWFRPYLAVDDLVSMPDFSAAARILEGRRPGDPVVIDLPPLPAPGGAWISKTIKESSRAAYCRRREEVEAELASR
jgi:Helicase HerA, central domain/Type IV secretion-system coupling protein DNA-binding domain